MFAADPLCIQVFLTLAYHSDVANPRSREQMHTDQIEPCGYLQNSAFSQYWVASVVLLFGYGVCAVVSCPKEIVDEYHHVPQGHSAEDC